MSTVTGTKEKAAKKETDELMDFEEKQSSNKKNGKSFRIVTYIIGGLLILSLLGNIFLNRKYRAYRNAWRTEKSKVEQLTSDNLLLEDRISSLTGRNQELDKSLDDAFQNMAQKDMLISHLNKENETLRQIKSEVDKITNISRNLSSQSDALRSTRAQLKNIQDKVNRTINAKRLENQKLSEGLK